MAHWLYCPSKESWIIEKCCVFHSVSAYLAPRSHKSVEAPTVNPEGRNGTISELAVLIVMQGIEVSECWRSSRRERLKEILTDMRRNSLTGVAINVRSDYIVIYEYSVMIDLL